MNGNLFETIRRIVREEMRSQHFGQLAVVQEQHPHADDGDKDNYACTVSLRNSGLVLEKVPLSTQRMGMAAIPPVGTLVMVQFLEGDLNAPVIVGSFYNDEDRPPANDDGQWVAHLPLGAEDADAVHAQLTSGDQREFQLKLGEGLALHLRDDDPAVELAVQGDKALIQVDGDGAVTIESKGDLNIKANNIKINGTKIEMESDGELNLKGAVINLN